MILGEKKHMLAHVSTLAITASLAVMTFGAATSASAQDTDTNGEVVVVTGIKKGLQDSIAIKKKSTSIVEAISSEDIGKLPDVSIAESLARLPGLAGQRVNGQAQLISLRGLAPDFTSVLMNGRVQVSSGDNRAAEFDQYPGELIGSAIVYKTQDSSIVGQGMAGTVNLRTIRPLDFKNRVIALNFRASYNSNDTLNDEAKHFGNRISFAYINQFMDGKVGLALGYAHLDNPTSTQHSKSWWWDAQGASKLGTAHQNAFGLHGVEAWAQSRDAVRDGVMGIVEFKPSDNFHSVNDIYYSKFSQDDTIRGAMWFQTQWQDNITITNPGFEMIQGSEVQTSGVVGGVSPIIRNDFNSREDTMFTFGSNNTWTLADWTVIADLGYSKSDREESITETYAGYGTSTTARDRVLVNVTESIAFNNFPTLTPDVNYGDSTKVYLGDNTSTAWGGWGHDGSTRKPKVSDQLTSLRLTANRALDFGFVKAVDMGVDYTTRTKEKEVAEFDLCLKGRTSGCWGPRKAVTTGLVSPTNLKFVGFGSILSYDVPTAIGTYYDLVPIKDESNYGKYWKVEEKTQSAYVKLDINSDLGDMTLRGNIGVQYVGTDMTSSGYITKGGSPVTFKWFSVDASSSDVLPSLNLILDIDDKQKIRFGAAKSMMRPRMDQLRANSSASVGLTGVWSGNGGNPDLKPWRSNNFDLAYEYYASKGTLFAANWFVKRLDSYIRTKTITYDFTGYPNLTGTTPTSNIGTFSTPVNGTAGKLEGIELRAAVEGNMLAPVLDGFGVDLNFARSWTTMESGDDIDPSKLPGFSGSVRNITYYYEKNGFSARISERWRSDSLGETYALFANRAATRILEDRQVDAQLTYDLNDGPLKGTTLLVQAFNLLDSPYQTQLKVSEKELASGGSFPEIYETYGKTIMFGFNYKY